MLPNHQLASQFFCRHHHHPISISLLSPNFENTIKYLNCFKAVLFFPKQCRGKKISLSLFIHPHAPNNNVPGSNK